MKGIRKRSMLGRTWFAAALAVVSVAPAASQILQSRLLRYEAVVDGTAERALRWPVDVAAGAADELAVADAWQRRAVVFRRVGAGWSVVREVALPATPVAITYAGGRYVVAVRGTSPLVAFASGEANDARRELPLPPGVVAMRLAASSDGALWIADARRGRVVKVRDGASEIETPFTATVTALASDGAGGFWAATGATGEVHHHDAAGERIVSWRVPAADPVPAWPAGLVAEPGGRLLVVDRHGHRVVVLDPAGNLIGVGGGKGWEPGQLLLPGGMAKLPDGGVVVGDSGNGRAQVFELLGAGTG